MISLRKIGGSRHHSEKHDIPKPVIIDLKAVIRSISNLNT